MHGVSDFPRHRYNHPVGRLDRLRTEVLQEKASCPVGVLGESWGEAALAEQGCLLIARDSSDRDTLQAQRSSHIREALTRSTNSLKHGRGNAEHAQQIL